MKKKNKIIIVFIAIVIIASGVALYYFVLAPATTDSPSNSESPVQTREQREKAEAAAKKFEEEYYSILFSEGDAIDLCEQEARSRNPNIIQLSVDALSTRFVEEKGTYMVKIHSYVGTPMLYDEKLHECTIDPKVEGVAFYKEIMKRKAVRPID